MGIRVTYEDADSFVTVEGATEYEVQELVDTAFSALSDDQHIPYYSSVYNLNVGDKPWKGKIGYRKKSIK